MIRDEYLIDKLMRYLDRRAVPQSLKGKPQAIKEELLALQDALLRFAPKLNYQEWFNRLQNRLDEGAIHRAWPTVGEIAKAVNSTRPKFIAKIAEKGDFDTLKVNADRIRAAEPVGDGYLYGRGAVELIRAGHLSESNLASHRNGAFLARREFYGEQAARAWEQEQKQLHKSALNLPDVDLMPQANAIPPARGTVDEQLG